MSFRRRKKKIKENKNGKQKVILFSFASGFVFILIIIYLLFFIQTHPSLIGGDLGKILKTIETLSKYLLIFGSIVFFTYLGSSIILDLKEGKIEIIKKNEDKKEDQNVKD